jgi:hypothetical protein
MVKWRAGGAGMYKEYITEVRASEGRSGEGFRHPRRRKTRSARDTATGVERREGGRGKWHD